MRFLIDADVHECLKFILDEWGQDAVHVKLSRLPDTMSDQQVIAHAAAEDRVIITYNTIDYEILHRQYMEDGKSHAGILCCQQLSGYRNFGRVLQWLRNMLKIENHDSLHDALRYLHSQYP